MITGLLVARLIASSVLSTHVSHPNSFIVVSSLDTVPGDTELYKAITSENGAELELKKLGFYYREVGQVGVIWDGGVYDVDAAAERTGIWQKIAKGEVKSGDVVLLGEVFGAFASKQPMLFQDWGVTEENCQNLKMQFNIYRKVTVENESGQQMTRVFRAGEPNGPPAPKNDPLEKPAASGKGAATPQQVSEHKIKFLGFIDSPLNRYEALGGFFDWVATQLEEERSLVEQAVKQFASNLEQEHPEWVKGSTVLNEQELQEL